MAGQIMRLAKRAYSAVSKREFRSSLDGRLHPPRDISSRYNFKTQGRSSRGNRIIWPAIALVQDQASWGWEALAEVDQWFEDLEPVLSCENKMQVATS